jgi:sodium transport system permease protein
MSPWRVVLAKELRETLRDRRTLLMMIVIPVLLYPVLLIVMEQLLLFGQRNLEAEAAKVAVVGEPAPGLIDLIEGDSGLRLVDVGSEPEAALRANSVGAVAIVGEVGEDTGTRRVTLLYDAASDRSNRARSGLASSLRAWGDSALMGRLDARGLPRSFAQPVAIADSSIARPDEVGGYALGRILPLLLVVITLLGAFYPAIDLAAGEKERGTLETLMTAPVPPRAIVAGKFVTVALIGVVAACLNLGSMVLTFQTGVLQLTAAIGLEVSLPWSAIAAIFVTLVPLAVLFGAVFLGIAVGASSFKEAQNSLTPVYVVVLVPAMLPAFPGIDFGPMLALTPVAGVSFFFRDLMTGEADLALGTLVLVSTTLYALIALAFAARAFGSERVLFGGGDAEVHTPAAGPISWFRAVRRSGGIPSSSAVLLFVSFVAVAFFWLGVRLQIALGESGLLAAEWLVLLLPAVAFVALGRLDPVRTLSLRRPTRRGLAGGVILIAGAMPLVWVLGWLQTFILPVPWEMLEGLEQLMAADSVGRLAWLLLLLAVTPALCEEAVFRGVLLGGTGDLDPWRRIVLNGLVFGLFHLSFETAIRFLPSATLGMFIAWAVVRTGSIWVGVLMHFLNNGVIVFLASTPGVREYFSDPEAPPPLWLVPLAAALVWVGVRALQGPAAAAGIHTSTSSHDP